jgi:hypothetical protein
MRGMQLWTPHSPVMSRAPHNGLFMPIYPSPLRESFDPETIDKMLRATRRVCETLGLKGVEDAAATAVAEKIVELAQRGVSDVAILTAQALRELRQ